MIISEILCFFDYIACPLFLLPLDWSSQPQIYFDVTSIGVVLHIITTNLESGYWKVKFSDALWNKLNFGRWIINLPGRICQWGRSMHHWSLGQWRQTCNRSFSNNSNTITSGTVDWRWLWMTLCCSNSSCPLSYIILEWSYRPCSNALWPPSYVSACSQEPMRN